MSNFSKLNSLDFSALLDRDKKYLSPALVRIFDLFVESGKGSFLYTKEQEEYLDLTSGIGVTQLGHCHPEIVQAIQKQAEKLIHVSCVTRQTNNLELAQRLAQILPDPLENTFFCNSGAEAVEGALKFAKYLRPGRANVISFRGAFHGRTMGALSVSASKSFHRKGYEPLLPGVSFVDFPNCQNCPVFQDPDSCSLECFDLIERMSTLNLDPSTVCAVIIEPILGEGGYVPAPRHRFNFLARLREFCSEHQILLIVDEVQSGIGRTGKWFAFEHYGIVPDLVTMAKGLGSGLPIGAFTIKKEFREKLPAGIHGSTYGGNPIACQAALKTLEIIERDNLLAYVSDTGREVINNLRKNLRQIKVRGEGFMIGLEFEDKTTVQKIIKLCFEEKILVLSAGAKGNVLRLIPPLNIKKEVLFSAVDKISELISKVC